MRSGFYSVTIILLALCAPVLAYDWTTNTGDGSPENPYQISEPEHLVSVGADPNLFDSHFVLTDDIVLPAPQTTGPKTFNCPVIGTAETPFTGTFDGQGHTIAGLYLEEYEDANYIGLFGVVQSLGENSGAISNLILAGPYVYTTSWTQNSGALIGHLIDGRVFQCAVIPMMEDGIPIGRVWETGHFYNVATTEEKNIGGLVGLNTKGSIIRCYTEIEVQLLMPPNLWNHVGGLVGKNDQGIIESCYAAAAVGREGGYIDGGFAGGLIGFNSGGCVLTSYAAPMPGANDKPVGAFTGKDSGGDYFLCCVDPNALENYTAIGVEIKTPAEMKQRDTFRGWGDGAWVLDDGADSPRLAWQNTPGTPITNQLPHYAGSGTPEDPYQISDANALNAIGYYRELLDRHYELMNDITAETPVDGTVNFHSIGTRCMPFSGTFNGKYYTITGLYGRSTSTGLFGAVMGSNAIIENLTLRNCTIETLQNSVGAVAGYAEKAAIRNCVIKDVTISGRDHVGGLVGWMKSGTIERCSVSASVKGINMVGGLVGRSGAGGARADGAYSSSLWQGSDPNDTVFISQCQTQTVVDGENVAGGFLGTHSRGAIENCLCKTVFAADTWIAGGFIGVNLGGLVSNCYAVSPNILKEHQRFGYRIGGLIGYDYDEPQYNACYYHAKGRPNYSMKPPGTYLTEAQMNQRASFEGWDFAGESANGIHDIWRMCADGIGYPQLNWLAARSGDPACPDGIEFNDLAAYSRNWLTSGAGLTDINHDGLTDLADFENIVQNWLAAALNLQDDFLFIAVLEAGPNPDPFAVTVTNLGPSAADYTVNSPAAGWLSMTPASGHLQAGQSDELSLTVDVVSTGLIPGFYETSYDIASPDAHSPRTGRIVLEVVNRYPILSLDREYAQLWVREQIGPNPAPDTVVVENTGNEDAHYTIDGPDGLPDWLHVTPSSGIIPQGDQVELSIAVDIFDSGLTPGEYAQEINIVCPEAEESPLVVTLYLTVHEMYPVLHLFFPPDVIQAGENGPNPEPIELWLENFYNSEVEFFVDYPGGKSDWLTITPDSGSVMTWDHAALTLSIDVVGANLHPGTYVQEVYLYDNPFHLCPFIFEVYLEVYEQYPMLMTPVTQINLNALPSGPNPEPVLVPIVNFGEEISHFTVEYPTGQPAWLSVSPSSGTLEPMSSTALSVTADVVGSALAEGSYNAVFRVFDPSSLYNPEIFVVLEVTN